MCTYAACMGAPRICIRRRGGGARGGRDTRELRAPSPAASPGRPREDPVPDAIVPRDGRSRRTRRR